MKIEMLKMHGGTLCPLDELQAEKLTALKTGEQYQVEIKRQRNPAFHRKVFAFFNFCFQHWSAENTRYHCQNEQAQFDTFRKHLTVLAGYFIETYNIKGNVRIEAKSLSFANMEQDEFEACYNALIMAAIKHIFNNTQDQNIINQLYEFFW